MPRREYYSPGEWNAQCDQCGRIFKSASLMKEWDGLRVCGECLDPRHPQELLRPITDPKPVPWTRPEPPPQYIVPSPPTYSSHSVNGMGFNYYSVD